MSPVTRCLVRPDTYRDSVVLMRVAAELEGLPGVARAALMMATPANRALLAEAGLLDGDAVAAGPGDLVIAVTAADARAVGDALASAARLLDRAAAAPASGASAVTAPRTIAEAAARGGANLAMISTPGAYATAEALKALKRGLSVFLFSDNVPVEDEIELKRLAVGKRLLMMGPDCGTAIVDGVPLGFANAVRRGRVGLAGASGTGLQQVSCLVDRLGEGVSQVIGVGSRDLGERVGGVMMRAAIERKGELETSYGASQFALIVTAEPHFAVGTPSDMITLYNVADKVEGEESKVTTLVERNDYSALTVVPIGEDPLELAQARYAVAIAKAAGADRFAPQQYASATQSLTQAETALAGGRKDRKTATDSARAAVIAGEDARRAALAGADAEAERQRTAAAAAAAQQEATRAAAVQARQDLRNRLNAALPTEETDRGLVSEVGAAICDRHCEPQRVRTRGSRAFRRHRRVVSGPAIQRRRSHRHHRQPRDQQRPVVAPRRRSARIPHRTSNCTRTNRRRGPRPVEADRRQFNRGRTRPKPSSGNHPHRAAPWRPTARRAMRFVRLATNAGQVARHRDELGHWMVIAQSLTAVRRRNGRLMSRPLFHLDDDRTLRNCRCASAGVSGVLGYPFPRHLNALIRAGLILADSH